jgi:type IV pilus assembly protein PilF
MSAWLLCWQRSLQVSLTLIFCLFAIMGCAFEVVDERIDALTRAEPDARRQKVIRRLALASAYFEQGQMAAAEQEVRATLLIDPNEPQAYSLLGLIHQQSNDGERAEQSFEQALRLLKRQGASAGAELAAVQHNLAWFLCQQRRFNESFTFFDQALAQPRYPARSKTWRALSVCAERAGQLERAKYAQEQLAQEQRLRQDFLPFSPAM